MLKGLELKRDMESILLASQASNAGAAATARALGGINAWIATNDDFDAGGSSPTASGSDGSDARNDGTTRAFTEAQLKNVFQLCWTSGGKPDTVMLGGFNKQVMSTFTGRATLTEDTKSKKTLLRLTLMSLISALSRLLRTASSGRVTAMCCRWICGPLPISASSFATRLPRLVTLIASRFSRSTRLLRATRNRLAASTI